jgi:macrolide transport system ATP-binding/permease protein
VAAQAQRVIRISDGRIQPSEAGDQGPESVSPSARPRDSGHFMARMAQRGKENASRLADVHEAVASAWRRLSNNRFRARLTLLGIMIGVASVIVLMAVGQGAGEKLLEKLSEGGNTPRISIWRIPATHSDVPLLREVENIAHSSPFGTGRVMLGAGSVFMERTTGANQQINAHAQPLISPSAGKLDMSHIKLIGSSGRTIDVRVLMRFPRGSQSRVSPRWSPGARYRPVVQGAAFHLRDRRPE